MQKSEIARSLRAEYKTFTNAIMGMSDEEFGYSHQGKWNAGNQLEHLLLCTRPLVGVFAMDKSRIETLFGRSDGEKRSFDELAEIYRAKLSDGGTAPPQYVPSDESPSEKEMGCNELMKAIEDLCSLIEGFSEEDLDTLQLPHPLLQAITMREMLYNAIYHVQHHHQQAVEYVRYLRKETDPISAGQV